MYFRVNVIPCHKPWRGSDAKYTTDPEVFKYFNELEELYNHEAPDCVYTKTEDDFPSYEEYEDYRETVAEDWYYDSFSKEIEFPITIIDECWVYTE